MRFASAYSRPSLTPLGQRLLSMSERKLYDLDAPIGARESGTALLREVLVRQAVRSAWDAVEQGRPAAVSDWSSPNALGLDVIGEDDEEEDGERADVLEEKEDKWFEDLLSELGEEEASTPYWEARTSAPPPSPELDHPVDGHSAVQVAVVDLAAHGSLSSVHVVEVEVDIEDSISDCSECSDCSSLSHIEYLDAPHLDRLYTPPPTMPIAPADRDYLTRETLATLEDIDECDDLFLPPPLHRSWSSSSSTTETDSECQTPQIGCDELEESSEMDWGMGSVGSESESEAEWDDHAGGEAKRQLLSAWPGRARVFRGC